MIDIYMYIYYYFYYNQLFLLPNYPELWANLGTISYS